MILRFDPNISSLDLLRWLDVAALMFLSTPYYIYLCMVNVGFISCIFYIIIYVKSCVLCNGMSCAVDIIFQTASLRAIRSV